MKLFAYFVMLAVIIAEGSGCNRGDTSEVARADTLHEIRLGFFPNVTHAQAVLGVSSGDFEKAVAPARFTASQFNAGPNLIEALNNGQIDVGYVGPGPVIYAFAHSHGEAIRVISGAAANGVLIVARKGAGIYTMADLKGKKIATPQHGNTQDIAARHYLTATLGQTDTNNVLPVSNTDQFGMIQRGQIDAAWVPEPWGSLLISQAGAILVGEEKDLWPGKEFSLTVIVTTPEFLKAHADVLRKLVVVNHDWTQRLNSNPSDCIPRLEAALTSLTGKSLPASVVADAASHVKFTDIPLPATFSANAQWAHNLQFVKEKTDITGLVDLRILKSLPIGSN